MSIQGMNISDLKSHGWNCFMDAAHFAAGYLAAYMIRDLAKKILKDEYEYRKHLATGIAVAGGLAASTLLLSPLHLSSSLEDKYLKLFALQAVLSFAAAWISEGSKCLYLPVIGCSGYFGERSLIFFAGAGAILGAARPFCFHR